MTFFSLRIPGNPHCACARRQHPKRCWRRDQSPPVSWILLNIFSFCEFASTKVSRYWKSGQVKETVQQKFSRYMYICVFICLCNFFSKRILMQKKKGTGITWTASYCPCLSRISASWVECRKKEEDSSPVLPQMIQLVKPRTELVTSCGLGRHLDKMRLGSPEEFWLFSKSIKAKVKSHLPSFSFHDLFPVLLSRKLTDIRMIIKSMLHQKNDLFSKHT